MASFLPTFFGWRFGAIAAERQLAAFEAGLRAEAGSNEQLRAFCGVLGLQLDQLPAASRDRDDAVEQQPGTLDAMPNGMTDADADTSENGLTFLGDAALRSSTAALPFEQASGVLDETWLTLTLTLTLNLTPDRLRPDSDQLVSGGSRLPCWKLQYSGKHSLSYRH